MASRLSVFGLRCAVLSIYIVSVYVARTTGLPTDIKRLVVTVNIEPPYVMLCSHPVSDDCIPATLNGNTTHIRGFLVDLLKKLSEKGNFRYEVHRVKDNQYGRRDVAQAGGWTGIIGELIRNEADLGLAAFTVTDERSEVISFTDPFLDYGLSILLSRPLHRIPVGTEAIESLMLPINNVSELASQTDIKYGVVAGGMTSRFFQNSKVDPYKTMWTVMSANPEQSLLPDYNEALYRVRMSPGRFAFIMETSSAEYFTRRYCDTVAIEFDKGVEYNAKGYSLGLPFGSKWTETLSRLIVKLKADGSIAAMRDKWWPCECAVC